MSLQIELISAFSVKVSWDPVVGSDAYTVQWKDQSTTKEATTTLPSTILVNLQPNTSYEIGVRSASGSIVSDNFQTCPVEDPHLENLYESVKLEDGTYDATIFDKTVHDVFLKYFSDVVETGDTIFASVILKGAHKNIETRAVVEGSSTDVSGDQNLFLPFSKDSNSIQTVTLNNAVSAIEVDTNSDAAEADAADASTGVEGYASNVELVYTPQTDSFTIGGREYVVGDKFNLFGKMVTVADGSIVLVFEDTVAKAYPFDTSTAEKVLGPLGSQFAKNVTCNVINVVGSQTTGAAGSTTSSSWVYNTDTDTVAEATRIVHTLDETSASAKLSIGVRHTDANSNAFIEPVIECVPTSTTISAQDNLDNTVSTTIDSTGISFDTDEASIYFGAAQKFRIIFRDGTPSTLAIESYDADTGTYMTRSEFSDAS